MNIDWLTWTQKLNAIAQNGLTYAHNPYDLDRYRQLRQLTAEIMAAYTEMDAGPIANLFERETGYATPKVDVRGAVFQENRILLVKERSDSGWTLPGGWADIGDSPSEAVVREIYEEAGYQTKAVKLLAVYDRSRHEHPPLPSYVYKFFFRCEIDDQPPVPISENFEIEEVAFFKRDEIPPLSLTRVTPAQITRLFEHYDNPDWPTEFD